MQEELEYENVEDNYRIPIEELEVDPQNIRGGNWDGDEEFIRDIEGGVDHNIVVRPLERDESGDVTRWGIVSGSRRYHASVEVGHDTLPCKPMELTDSEAKMKSMSENRNRKDTPRWKDIEFVGEVWEEQRASGHTPSEIRQSIEETIGMSHFTIERYMKVYRLPEEVRCLIRDYSDLTSEQCGYLEGVRGFSAGKLPLQISTLITISDYFGKWDVSNSVEAAFSLDKLSGDKKKEVASDWQDSPEKSIEEVKDSELENRKTYKRIGFESDVYSGLQNAVGDRNKELKDLVNTALSEWLEEEGHYEGTVGDNDE